MNYDGYVLIGIGVALSVLGFFLKRIKEEVDVLKSRNQNCVAFPQRE